MHHTRCRRSLRFAAPLVLAALAFAPSANAAGVTPSAATPVQREQAQSRFLRGKELYNAGKFDAALAEFTAHGVIEGSIAGIRRRSGASVGSIYHHFASKEDIATTLYIEGMRDYQHGFVVALAEAGSTRAGVEGAVLHHLAWIAQHRDVARFLLLERDARVIAASSDALRHLNRRFFRAVLDWTEPRVKAGELRELPPELLTALWIGPSQDLARHWLAGRSRISLSDAAPELAGAAWRSLTAGG